MGASELQSKFYYCQILCNVFWSSDSTAPNFSDDANQGSIIQQFGRIVSRCIYMVLSFYVNISFCHSIEHLIRSAVT